MLVRKYGRPRAGIFGWPDYYTWLRQCGVGFASRILDVGCATGVLLRCLQNDGFTNVTGVDPFVEHANVGDGLDIRKQGVFEVSERFDLIMLHHTFEHMPAPLEVLRHLHRILDRNRYVLIRIPVADSYAFRTYGVNWAQLDAPRHFFLHTVKSMRILAEQAGFELAHTEYDSDEFQFWASEQYAKDIPLRADNSYATDPANSIFSHEQILGFQRQARELNVRNDGDSACFYLLKR